MADPERRSSYIALWIFSLAFGWIEAATVVYVRSTSPSTASSAVGVQFPFVLTSGQLVASEIVPDALTNWDLLFLIPRPWVAPVWAPATIAAMFVAAGSYLYWTAERARQYTSSDFAILIASAVAVIASFLVDWRIAIASEVLQRFPQWLYWAGVAVGTCLVRARRTARSPPMTPQQGQLPLTDSILLAVAIV
jgi:hypothetical protein